VRLICGKLSQAAQAGLARLEAAGYEVDATPLNGPAGLRRLAEMTPAAVLIDLTRAPSQGRDIGLALRASKATRAIPLVFVEGEGEKLAQIQQLLPDAVFTTWRRIRSGLRHALAHPPRAPVVPTSALAGYAGVPLVRKLGIKPQSVVLLLGAPRDFARTLEPLPPRVRLLRRAQQGANLVLWFTRTQADLQRRLYEVAQLAGQDGLWIMWPKKTSRLASDLTQQIVRQTGLNAGLVDYKICAVDSTWSGLKFTRR